MIGSLFKKFRDVILGYQHISVLQSRDQSIDVSVPSFPSPPIEERVDLNIPITESRTDSDGFTVHVRKRTRKQPVVAAVSVS